MSRLLVSDDLWSLIQPLLPIREKSSKGGKPSVCDRVCLTGILFVLKSGIPWEDFPQEMGCCGMTLWNRLHEWEEAGVWQKLHELLLSKLRGADQIDFSRVICDSSSIRAVHGGKKQARIPRIDARPAPSTISWSMPAACLSSAT